MSKFLIQLNNRLFPKVSLFLAFVGGPIGIGYLAFDDPRWLAFSILGFFLFDSLGVQVGTHKLISHESFRCPTLTRNLLALFSILSGQGSPLVWAAIHRNSHHAHTDTELDFHSPHKGWFHAFVAWFWKFPAKDLKFYGLRKFLKSPFLIFLHHYHFYILIFYWVLLFSIDIKLFLALGLIPSFASLFFTGLVNANLHRRGGSIEYFLIGKYQNTKDDSQIYNSRWLGLVTFGLGYHHNHHLKPNSPNCGTTRKEWDPSYLIIQIIKKRKSV